MFNPIAIAQLAANLTVKAVAARVTTNLVVNNTSHEADDITTIVASGCVAMAVADATHARTDQLVIDVATWIDARKNQKTK